MGYYRIRKSATPTPYEIFMDGVFDIIYEDTNGVEQTHHETQVGTTGAYVGYHFIYVNSNGVIKISQGDRSMTTESFTSNKDYFYITDNLDFVTEKTSLIADVGLTKNACWGHRIDIIDYEYADEIDFTKATYDDFNNQPQPNFYKLNGSDILGLVEDAELPNQTNVIVFEDNATIYYEKVKYTNIKYLYYNEHTLFLLDSGEESVVDYAIDDIYVSIDDVSTIDNSIQTYCSDNQIIAYQYTINTSNLLGDDFVLTDGFNTELNDMSFEMSSNFYYEVQNGNENIIMVDTSELDSYNDNLYYKVRYNVDNGVYQVNEEYTPSIKINDDIAGFITNDLEDNGYFDLYFKFIYDNIDTYDITLRLENTGNIKITLYKYNENPKIVNKELTNGVSIYGNFTQHYNVASPSVVIEYTTLPLFTYAYISKLKRYYFVDGISNIGKDLWELDLKEDLYTTNKDLILNRKHRILRGYVSNMAFPKDDNRIRQTASKTMTKELFDLTGRLEPNYIITFKCPTQVVLNDTCYAQCEANLSNHSNANNLKAGSFTGNHLGQSVTVTFQGNRYIKPHADSGFPVIDNKLNVWTPNSLFTSYSTMDIFIKQLDVSPIEIDGKTYGVNELIGSVRYCPISLGKECLGGYYSSHTSLNNNNTDFVQDIADTSGTGCFSCVCSNRIVFYAGEFGKAGRMQVDALGDIHNYFFSTGDVRLNYIIREKINLTSFLTSTNRDISNKIMSGYIKLMLPYSNSIELKPSDIAYIDNNAYKFKDLFIHYLIDLTGSVECIVSTKDGTSPKIIATTDVNLLENIEYAYSDFYEQNKALNYKGGQIALQGLNSILTMAGGILMKQPMAVGRGFLGFAGTINDLVYYNDVRGQVSSTSGSSSTNKLRTQKCLLYVEYNEYIDDGTFTRLNGEKLDIYATISEIAPTGRIQYYSLELIDVGNDLKALNSEYEEMYKGCLDGILVKY